jgi:hypothetical protein
VKFASNFERIGTIGQSLVAVVASVTIGWVGFAAAVGAAVFAATALATILGTLVAIVADFVAPLTLVGSLLGLLGVGFGLAAKRAADGGIHLKGFSDELAVLGSMFHRTTTILAQLFLPYLIRLAHAGEIALNFFDKIAKLPLKEAFQRIATQGTQLLTQFINEVTKVVARPIRLAFKLAFGEGPAANEFQSTVSAWWNRFTNYLFGYVERHPLTKLDILKGSKPTVRRVDGIFQPLIDWFNRHHFTKQGEKIGREILRGLRPLVGPIGDFIVEVIKDAGKRAGRAFLAVMNQPLGPLLLALVKATWNKIDQTVNDAGHRARQYIIAQMGNAWDWVKNKVSNIWSSIVDFITSPISVHINWPSPPSWLSNLPGGRSGIDVIGGLFGSVAGVGSSVSTAAAPRTSMDAPMVIVNIHGADLSDPVQQRRVAQKIGKHIVADWRQRAAGH